MNNTEKANEIAEKYFFEYTYEYSEEELGTSKLECFNSAFEMAEWKDCQIKKVLDEVMNIFSDKSSPTDFGAQLAVKTIKNKLNL